MKISKEQAVDLMEGQSPDGFTIVEPETLVETTRWGARYSVIFEHPSTDRCYELIYEIGGGDSDYTSADTDWGDEVEVHEVAVKTITQTVWERV